MGAHRIDRTGGGHAPPPSALDAASFLALAAAPTFAFMALATSIWSGGQPDMLCLGVGHAWPLNGMAMMYALMAAFHCAPWLRLIASVPVCFGLLERAEPRHREPEGRDDPGAPGRSLVR